MAIAEGDRDCVGSLRVDSKRRIGHRGVIGVGHIGRLLVTLIEASVALEDTASARAYARQGTAFLTERADGLTDPANRESYLNDFPSHRRVFELAVTLG